MKPYPKYKPSGIEWIGKIPDHWEIKRIKYILNGDSGIQIGPFGSSLKSEYIKPAGIKVYGQENIIKDDFAIGYRYIDDDKFEELKKYEIFPGDVLITMMGTTGKSKIVPINCIKGIIDSHLIRIRINNKVFLPELFSLIINDAYFMKSNIKYESKGSIMDGLNSQIIKSLFIPFPSLSEQEGILDFIYSKLVDIDNLVLQKQQLIELLQKEKTTVINEAVTKGLNPDVKMKDSSILWLGEIPEHWNLIKLKYLGDIKYGLGTPPKQKPGGLPLIRATNVKRGEISEHDLIYVDPEEIPYERDPVLKENDIIVVRSGAYTGDSAIIPKQFEGAITGYDMVVRIKNAIPKFIAYSLLSNYLLVNQLELLMLRAAQPHLNREDLGETLVVLPPNTEQEEIVKLIENKSSSTSSSIEKIQLEIKLLQEYRTALISEAVTGKIDVRDYKGSSPLEVSE